jgi:photosystem II stability/assembly factor-like uncharacterized protein
MISLISLRIAFSILLLILSFSAHAQTTINPVPLPPSPVDIFVGMPWRSIGPTFTTGRIADIAIDPKNVSTWYVAVGSGGLWKTTNRGIDFTPIFDNYGSYSMGCVVVDPKDSNVVWLGTGENSNQRSVAFGDGVYKSIDAGKTWQKMGLENSEHIAKIVIHPKDSNTVYVAAQGPLWASGGDRGLYKTTDGGKTWSLALSVSADTGITDVVLDPKKPERIYAAAYQRRRHTGMLVGGGPEAGIFRSDNGGKTWEKINSGLPTGDLGRIALAVSPQKPDVLYATVVAKGKESGFFRSDNRGKTWVRQKDFRTTDAQYYGELFADPRQFDKVFIVDTQMQETSDGGKTIATTPWRGLHPDYHALAFDPTDKEHLLTGNDGGLYESYDNGKTWRQFVNLPIAQFYRIGVDNNAPFYRVYGGAQDNGTMGGPTRTPYRVGIRTSDWERVGGGDGFQARVDPTNPSLLYTQSQFGAIGRMDRSTGESRSIRPTVPAAEGELIWNWDTPFIISPHNPSRLYMGANMLFLSENKGDKWQAISKDLTRDLDRKTMPMMGKVWPADAITLHEATTDLSICSALDESPKQAGLLYYGTDEGLIQVTEDTGKTWRREEKFPAVPEFATVSDICASNHDVNVVYASFHDFQHGDFAPYLLKSNDKGKTWQSITGNLLAKNFIWSIAEDPIEKDLLFVGTEFGLYFTRDGGAHWQQLRSNAPTICFRDILIQPQTHDLVAGTFGRGVYILDDISPLRGLTAEILAAPAALLPLRNPIAVNELGYQTSVGDNFVSPNPLNGAIFTYYLKEGLPAKDATVTITILGTDGKQVRTLTGPATPGLHRVNWTTFTGRQSAPAGTYTVRLDFQGTEYTQGFVIK